MNNGKARDQGAAHPRIKRITFLYGGPQTTLPQESLYVHLPLNLLSLAAYLEPHGFECEIVDMRITDYKSHDFSKTDALGISAMTGPQVKFGLEGARFVRNIRPDVPIIWGGIHASLHPEETALHELVDYVVIGEGEATLLELLQALNQDQDTKNVTGLAFEVNGQPVKTPARPLIKNLDDLPLPAYHLVNIDDYSNIRNAFDYQSSRGCPYRCAFCYNLQFGHRRYRAKSAEKVIEDLKFLKNKYQIRHVGFVDDELFIQRRRVNRLVDLMLEEDLGLTWNASCRLDILQRYSIENLKRMKQSGCHRLYFGAESGSQRMLDLIDKDIKVEDFFKGAQMALSAGIVPILSFMSGFPDESNEDLEQTVDVISRLWATDPKVVVNGVFIFNPYPGGKLFDRAMELGMQLPDSLDGWGNWDFKYDAQLPWVDGDKARKMKTIFFLVRFCYYMKMLKEKPDFLRRYVARAVFSPLWLSYRIRWKGKFWGAALEWDLWAWLMVKIFGFI